MDSIPCIQFLVGQLVSLRFSFGLLVLVLIKVWINFEIKWTENGFQEFFPLTLLNSIRHLYIRTNL